MAPKNTTEEFISKSIKVHGDFWHGNPKIYNNNLNKVTKCTFDELYEKTMQKEKLLRS
jgi:predicted nucleic-acid-binding Zn-ribbon protein